MNISFLGQGLNVTGNRPVGESIKAALASGQYNSLRVFVAFLSVNGLTGIQNELSAFKTAGHSIKIFVGVDLHGTSKEALQRLLDLNIETSVVYTPNRLIYHPKIYAFEGATNIKILIGSSNLTTTGLFQNVEASVCVEFPRTDTTGVAFRDELYQYYDGILNDTHPSCKRLTPEILDLLIDNKIVLSESAMRIKRNKSDGEFSKRDPISNANLLRTFQKIKEARPPSGYNRVISKEVYEVRGENDVLIVYEDAKLESGTMWVETGALTGGSANILDLSMTGTTSTKATIDGSVKFFDIDVNAQNAETNISILHAGKRYNGNTIKRHGSGARPNGTWRIQLKGITDGGERFTNITRSYGGNPGGLVNKILLFRKIENGLYEMEILSEDTMDKLKEKSSVWATNGKSFSSRAYGIIQG